MGKNNPQFIRINASTENRWFLFQKHKILAVAKFALSSSTDQSWERAVPVPSWDLLLWRAEEIHTQLL